jgi:hypothetical protein
VELISALPTEEAVKRKKAGVDLWYRLSAVIIMLARYPEGDNTIQARLAGNDNNRQLRVFKYQCSASAGGK